MIQPKLHSFRAFTILSIVALLVAALVPALFASRAKAASVTSRKITMSTSKWSATSVTYAVSFNVSSSWSGNLDGIAIDFCDNTPIIGDTTCTAPGGFSVGAGTFSSFQVNGSAVGGTYTAGQLNTNRTFTLSYTSGAHAAPTAGQSVTFNVTGVTNPNTGNHTFYARIYTYNAAAGATGYTVANPSNGAAVIDSGGIALSTANDLIITAKVQERLQFCVTTAAQCSTAGTEKDTTTTNRTVSINLGDTNGVLDTASNYVNSNVKLYIQTNAQGNAVVVVKGDTLCNPMPTFGTTCSGSGGTSIAAIGASQASYATGTEQFGFCATTSAGVTVAAPYGDGVANQDTTTQCSAAPNNSGTGTTNTSTTTKYGFDATNTNGATGSTVLTKTPGAVTSHTLAFMGSIANTTKAGIYGTTLQFIATGTY
ncbi:MAG: hypothetical protein U0491_02975 [Candidatus Saccharimonadales bacterium]